MTCAAVFLYLQNTISLPFNGGRWWGGFGLPVSSTGLLTLLYVRLFSCLAA
ncbi:hypothetical protein [Snodgrassella sp. B3088]|uniref:hypothetical protein n=1 Tax=Snodgrassella sp. B3088 TaxID=2818038 RepID=UPI002269D9B4|nr:hypothetical protein [Snodgrassella sp. B3088]